MQLSMFLSAATAAPSLVDSLFIIPQRTFSVNCFFELFQSFFSFFVRAFTPRKSRRRHLRILRYDDCRANAFCPFTGKNAILGDNPAYHTTRR